MRTYIVGSILLLAFHLPNLATAQEPEVGDVDQAAQIQQNLIPNQPEEARVQFQILADEAARKLDLRSLLVFDVNGADPVVTISEGRDYMLAVQTFMFGSELTFDMTTARVVGASGDLRFYQDCTLEQLTASSRIHVTRTDPLASGQRWNFFPCFRAQRTMRTRDMQFSIGIYATVRPEGKYWKRIQPSN